jgi:hypothetical protein
VKSGIQTARKYCISTHYRPILNTSCKLTISNLAMVQIPEVMSEIKSIVK